MLTRNGHPFINRQEINAKTDPEKIAYLNEKINRNFEEGIKATIKNPLNFEILKVCLEKNPEKRPTISNLIDYINELIAMHKKTSQVEHELMNQEASGFLQNNQQKNKETLMKKIQTNLQKEDEAKEMTFDQKGDPIDIFAQKITNDSCENIGLKYDSKSNNDNDPKSNLTLNNSYSRNESLTVQQKETKIPQNINEEESKEKSLSSQKSKFCNFCLKNGIEKKSNCFKCIYFLHNYRKKLFAPI